MPCLHLQIRRLQQDEALFRREKAKQNKTFSFSGCKTPTHPGHRPGDAPALRGRGQLQPRSDLSTHSTKPAQHGANTIQHSSFLSCLPIMWPNRGLRAVCRLHVCVFGVPTAPCHRVRPSQDCASTSAPRCSTAWVHGHRQRPLCQEEVCEACQWLK